jgi:hypothetical protein
MMVAAESAVYYPHHEGGRGSPMRIHDVAGKSAICYPHHAKRIHEESSAALGTSQFRMCLAICYPHS